MALLTASYDAPERQGQFVYLPLAANLNIYAGAIVAIDANGNANPAQDVAGLTVIGRAEVEVDNLGGIAGAQSIQVKRGVFEWDNSTANPVPVTAIGSLVYAVDDHTVATTSTNHIVAGRVVFVDSNGVWVDTTAQWVS